MAPRQVKKKSVESFVSSKLEYNNSTGPKTRLRELCKEPLLHQARRPESKVGSQRLGRNLLHLLKFAHCAIHTNTWPEYLRLP